MPKQNKESEPIKVTDKRLFTSDGEIRDEFKGSVTPADPQASRRVPAEEPAVQAASHETKQTAAPQTETEEPRPKTDRRFATLVDLLAQNAAMMLGMGRGPYAQAAADLPAARQMIDLLEMLSDKTARNLSEEEETFLKASLSELKLAYVQRSKAI